MGRCGSVAAESKIAEEAPVAGRHPNPLYGGETVPEMRTARGILELVFFRSPKETWKNLCGTEGWMAVCDRCHVQVNYFEEAIS